MGRYTRAVFGLNALYQTVLGLVFLLAPSFAAGILGGTESEQEITLLLVAVRMLGVGMILPGVMSVLIAGNPDSYPILRPLMGLSAVLSLVCWGIILGSHHLNPGQIGWVILTTLIDTLILVGAIFYNPKSKSPSIVYRRRGVAA